MQGRPSKNPQYQVSQKLHQESQIEEIDKQVWMRLRASVSGMKPQSFHGWTCSVSQKYLHISSLQAINYHEGATFKHTSQYKLSQKLTINVISFHSKASQSDWIPAHKHCGKDEY